MFGERVISPRMIVPAVLVHIALIWAAFATWFVTPELPKPREPFIVEIPVIGATAPVVVPDPPKPEPVKTEEPTPVREPVPSDMATEDTTPTTSTQTVALNQGAVVAGPQVLSVPGVMSKVAPIYPSIALRREREGRVILLVDIGADGRVRDIQVSDVNPEGYSFENAAIEAVSQWVYEPTIVDGVAVPRDDVKVVINFELKDA